jgi:hypothetical protein
MPTQVQFRRGTTAQNNSFTGAAGELSVDTTLNVLRLHDGSTAGGHALVSGSSTITLTNKTINLSSNTLTGTIAQFNTALSDADFATIAGSETLTNKTLTTPVIAEIDNASDITLMLAVTSFLTLMALIFFLKTTEQLSVACHKQAVNLLLNQVPHQQLPSPCQVPTLPLQVT